MKPFIEFHNLSYEAIYKFVHLALRSSQEDKLFDTLFLLGKAAGYTDVALALSIITLPQAKVLLDLIMTNEARIFEARQNQDA